MKKICCLALVFLLIFTVSCAKDDPTKNWDPTFKEFYNNFVKAHPDGYDIPKRNFSHSSTKTIALDDGTTKVITRTTKGSVDFKRYYFAGELFAYYESMEEVIVSGDNETLVHELEIFYDGLNYYSKYLTYSEDGVKEKICSTDEVEKIQLSMQSMDVYYPDNITAVEFFSDEFYVIDDYIFVVIERYESGVWRELKCYYDENYELLKADTKRDVGSEKYESTFEFVSAELEINVPSGDDSAYKSYDDYIVLY